MNPVGPALDDFFHEYRLRGEPLVLATVVRTLGSTYRKAGAQMLFAVDGASAGLLSGGCLEADLLERARTVLATGEAAVVDYDSRSSDDILWGMGLGCEGAMRILLSRLHPSSHYEPFAFQTRCRAEQRSGRIAHAIATTTAHHALGCTYRSDALATAPKALHGALSDEHARTVALDADGATFLIVPVALPLRLLVLGAGPDAAPLVEIAALQGWQVTIRDHRAAYAVPARFPRAHCVEHASAAALGELLHHARFDAAVVMSHHLPSDQTYLSALARSTVPYIGLLGPAPRRMRLLAEMGERAQQLDGRLYGPVGLDIGATTPEGIALAIASEIQAISAGRAGASFSRVAESRATASAI